jgi:PAS domain S-box-containing protein
MGNGSSMSFRVPIRDGLASKFSASLEPRLLLAALLTSIGYYLGSLIGFTLTFRPHPVSVLWPPNSILLAALLLTPPRGWMVVLLVTLPAHIVSQLQSEIPVPMMFCYFISNSFEAIVGAAATRYFLRGPVCFDTLRCIAFLGLCGSLLGPFLSSFLDEGFVQLNHWGTGHYWEIWRIRFFSNVLTALTFAPAIVVWFFRSGRREKRDWRKWVEAGLLFPGLLGVCYATLYRSQGGPPTHPVLYCLLVLLLLWAVLRFGPRGAISALFIVTVLTIWSAAHGHGPFTGESPEENARSIQLFLIVMVIPFLFLAAGSAERLAAEDRFTKAFRANPHPATITRVRDGKIVDVNEQWLALFGYGRGEVIGRTVYDLNVYVNATDREEMLTRLARDEAVRDFECSVRLKKGNVRRISYSAEQIDTGGEPCLIAIARDITDSERFEEAKRNLAHASRLAVVGELTATIAH